MERFGWNRGFFGNKFGLELSCYRRQFWFSFKKRFPEALKRIWVVLSLKQVLFPGPNAGCFSRWWPLLTRENRRPKNWKATFFQDKFYCLKAYTHYFTVYEYLSTWRAAKFDIFTHFTSTKLPQCSQNIKLIMYVYYTDSQLLLTSAWSQSWLHAFDYHCPSQLFCITPCFQ